MEGAQPRTISATPDVSPEELSGEELHAENAKEEEEGEPEDGHRRQLGQRKHHRLSNIGNWEGNELKQRVRPGNGSK